MADVAVTTTNVKALAVGTRVDMPTGQSVGVGDTAVLTPQTGAPFSGRYLLVRMVESGTQVDTVCTVKAGVTGGTPANQSSKGDLALTALSNNEDTIVQLELARHLQANGTVRIAVSGTAGGAATFSVLQPSKAA